MGATDTGATTGPLVVLVGPPGSGKSSVGAALAALTGVPLRDTDADIEALAGCTIAEIFTGRGEPAFRELEERAVAAALDSHPGVLALGGGSVLSARTRARLTGHPVAYLAVSATTGVQRVGLATNRPLMVGVNPRATYRALLADRVPLYREIARWEFETDTRSVAELARALAEALGLPPTVSAEAVPDTTQPDTTAPDTTAPDTTAPDTTAPDTTEGRTR